MIEVSVVICALNEEHRIGRQLAALDAQIGAPAFEIIVVDNGSSDRTVEVVREWADAADHVAAEIRILDGSRTPGIPAARNTGARAASGRVIAYCDADDEVRPGWVAAMAEAVDGPSLVGGRVLAYEPNGMLRGDLYGQDLAATSYLPHVGCANFAVDRDAFFSIGGFDESLPRYGFEDVDFSWRMQEAGHQIAYAPDAVVNFSLSGARASVRKRFQLGKGRVLMARRFPRYDSTEYTVTTTVREAGRAGGRVMRALVTRRQLDRALVSAAVAAAGRAAGAWTYRGGRTPQRKLLLDQRGMAESDSTPCRAPAEIVIAANNAEIGGGEVMLLHIAAALRELGIRVKVLAPASPTGIAVDAEALGFDVTTLPARSRAEYMVRLAGWRLRHREAPLWCNGLVPTLATTGLGPRLVHLHTLPKGLHAVAARIGRLGARRVLVPSRFMAARLPSTTVLENWTEDIAFRRRGIPEGEPLRVGYLGRLTRDKGVHVLARAMREVVQESGREVRLILAGENRFGSTEDDRAIEAALGTVPGLVDMLGWVARDEFFEKVDIAVYPSVVPESFGLVAAEAMAGGVPFIVSDAGALPEVVGTSYPWVARRGDESSLARTILRMLDTLDRGDDGTTESARRRWEQQFSPSEGTRRVAALLGSLPHVFRTEGREGVRDAR